VLRLLRRLDAQRQAGPRADGLLLERFALHFDYRQAQYQRLDTEIGLERAKGQVPK
jgi:hypothetical protein